MDLDELRRAVGARLGYCFRKDPADTTFAWHVRFPGGRHVLSYMSDSMKDIPRWPWNTEDALKLCSHLHKEGYFLSVHHRPDGRWGAVAWYQPADSDSLTMFERSEAEADTIAVAICKTFCLVMPEVEQE